MPAAPKVRNDPLPIGQVSSVQAGIARVPSGGFSGALTPTRSTVTTQGGQQSPMMPATHVVRLSSSTAPSSGNSISIPASPTSPTSLTSPISTGRVTLSASTNSYARPYVEPTLGSAVIRAEAHLEQHATQVRREQSTPTVVQQLPMPFFERRSLGTRPHVIERSPVHLQTAEIRKEYFGIGEENLKEFENRILGLLEQMAKQSEAKLKEQQGKILQLEQHGSELREMQHNQVMDMISKLSTSVEERFCLLSEEMMQGHRQRETRMDELDHRLDGVVGTRQMQEASHLAGSELKEMQEMLDREMNKLMVTIEERFARMSEEMPARRRGAGSMDHHSVRELVKSETAELEKLTGMIHGQHEELSKRHHELSLKSQEYFDGAEMKEIILKYDTMLKNHAVLSERLARAETNYNRALSGRSEAELESLKSAQTQHAQAQMTAMQNQQAQSLAELNTFVHEKVQAELDKLQTDLQALVEVEVRKIGNDDLYSETLARTRNVADLHARLGQEIASVRKTIEVYRGELGNQPASAAGGLTPQMEAGLDEYVRALVAREYRQVSRSASGLW